mgnify:CR=1 FL=1
MKIIYISKLFAYPAGYLPNWFQKPDKLTIKLKWCIYLPIKVVATPFESDRKKNFEFFFMIEMHSILKCLNCMHAMGQYDRHNIVEYSSFWLIKSHYDYDGDDDRQFDLDHTMMKTIEFQVQTITILVTCHEASYQTIHDNGLLCYDGGGL